LREQNSPNAVILMHSSFYRRFAWWTQKMHPELNERFRRWWRDGFRTWTPTQSHALINVYIHSNDCPTMCWTTFSPSSLNRVVCSRCEVSLHKVPNVARGTTDLMTKPLKPPKFLDVNKRMNESLLQELHKDLSCVSRVWNCVVFVTANLLCCQREASSSSWIFVVLASLTPWQVGCVLDWQY